MRIFISYAKRDTRELALQIYEVLKDIPGVEPWMDSSLEPAESWALQIQDQIDHSECLIVLLSPDVNRPIKPFQPRSFVLNEIDYALDAGKRVIPVMVQKTKLPVRLAGIQYIDFYSDHSGGIAQLVKNIRKRIGIESDLQPKPKEPASVKPYYLNSNSKSRSAKNISLILSTALVFLVVVVSILLVNQTQTPPPNETPIILTPKALQPSETATVSPTMSPTSPPTSSPDPTSTPSASATITDTPARVGQTVSPDITVESDISDGILVSRLDVIVPLGCGIQLSKQVIGEKIFPVGRSNDSSQIQINSNQCLGCWTQANNLPQVDVTTLPITEPPKCPSATPTAMPGIVPIPSALPVSSSPNGPSNTCTVTSTQNVTSTYQKVPFDPDGTKYYAIASDSSYYPTTPLNHYLYYYLPQTPEDIIPPHWSQWDGDANGAPIVRTTCILPEP